MVCAEGEEVGAVVVVDSDVIKGPAEAQLIRVAVRITAIVVAKDMVISCPPRGVGREKWKERREDEKGESHPGTIRR